MSEANAVRSITQDEARFRATFENAAVGIAHVALDGRWLEVNQRLCDLVGYSREELMSKTFADITHPDDVASDWQQRRLLLAGAIESLAIEKRYRRKDGAIVWANVTVSLARKGDGSPDYFISIHEDISARKRAEEALRASELRFRTMISALPALTFEADVLGNSTFASEQWCAYTGMTPEQTAGVGFVGAIHPDDVAATTARWRAATQTGQPFESQHRIRAANGDYRWFLSRALPGRDADGRIVRWAGSLADVDDLVQTEQALRESESRFRQLAESLPQLVWTFRPDGPCDYLSRQWIDYTGIAAAAQLGFGWLEQLHPDDREPTVAAWSHALTHDVPFDVEFRIRRHDGVYRWFKTRGVALRDSGGQVVKWFGSSTDIDDQKQAEEALRQSKEQLSGIVSSAMDAIVTVDEHQRVVLFNEAAERMFGCPAADAVGQPLDRFIPERLRVSHAEHVTRFGESGRTSRAMGSLSALRALRTDGTEFPIEASISKVDVAGRRLYTAILRDTTERERAEAQRELLAQEQVARAVAEAANRSKDELLAVVSHELRSPLNAILGYAQILRSEAASRQNVDEAAAIIERNANAQRRIIEDLLDSARIVSGKLRIEPTPTDVVPVLEAALETVRAAAAAKGVRLATRLAPVPRQVVADPTRLQQVVVNLLTNAVKFTPAGGGWVELRMDGDADEVRITVSDTGQGIAPDLLPFVFDRYRQADPSSGLRGGGLGLGLSLVKHLVELHGGTVTAASGGAGCGAVFTVTLPRRHSEMAVSPLAVSR